MDALIASARFHFHKQLFETNTLTSVSYTHLDVYKRQAGGSVPDELLSTIDLIAVTMQGLKGEDANE